VASLILPKQTRQAERLMRDAGVEAESLDVAPLGTGGRWEKAASALAGLTAAQEVPEPGNVPVFTLPVRERERNGRRDERGFGDRGRREGYGDRDFRGRREERGGYGDR